jgi:hypothetical protein
LGGFFQLYGGKVLNPTKDLGDGQLTTFSNTGLSLDEIFTKQWFFNGEIVYQDIFRNEHKRFFCFFGTVFKEAADPPNFARVCREGGMGISTTNNGYNREIEQQPGAERYGEGPT